MTPAGWYNDGAGHQRWWDGYQWTEHYAPAPQPTPYPYPQQPVPVAVQGRQANGMGVSYVRPQQGHSLVLWGLLSLFLFIPVIWLIYYSASPNHYWHA